MRCPPLKVCHRSSGHFARNSHLLVRLWCVLCCSKWVSFCAAVVDNLNVKSTEVLLTSTNGYNREDFPVRAIACIQSGIQDLEGVPILFGQRKTQEVSAQGADGCTALQS
jgi:hypothetical protein